MNINKINTNLSFKGYENLISYSGINEYEYSFGFSYMGMLLNNKDGNNDLDTWHEIQSRLFKGEPKTDYLVLTCGNIGEKDLYVLNKHRLSLENIKNSEEERIILKAYTLLASLTRRIICTEHHPENSKIYLTQAEIMKNLLESSNNKNLAYLVSIWGANKIVKHYVTAEKINNGINRKMRKYFKL